MTTLHDQLGDAVADVHPDLTALAAAARRRGLAHRRRQRALAAVGVAAAVAVVGGVGWSLTPEDAPSSVVPVVTDPPSAPATGRVRLTPLDGPATAGLLAELVAPYAVTATGSAGQSGSGESYAELELAGGGRVAVNVQPASAYDDPDGLSVARRDDGKVGTDRWVATYVDHGRGVRVSVTITVPTGATPPLSRAQLGALASDPAWGLTVEGPVPAAPTPYADLG